MSGPVSSKIFKTCFKIEKLLKIHIGLFLQRFTLASTKSNTFALYYTVQKRSNMLQSKVSEVCQDRGDGVEGKGETGRGLGKIAR